MEAILISVGDELVSGATADTNAPWLAERLVSLGIAPVSHHTVADDEEAIASAIRSACERAKVVLVTGGLGPTDDDLTRRGVARAMGAELVLDDECLAHIREFFRRRGRTMVPANRIQAMIPAGAQALRNRLGTAAGVAAAVADARVFLMPGVPQEMREMFASEVASRLPRPDGVIVRRLVHTYGMGESDIARKLRDVLQRREGDVVVGTTVAAGLVSLRIVVRGREENSAKRQADDVEAQVRERLGALVVGTDSDTMASVVGRLLRERGQTLATAESCTGGLLGQMITAVSGASDYYLGGVVSYADQAKRDLLGVPQELLEEHGAVSERVGAAMADGCRSRFAADWAVGITGIAGPTGGTDEKPVGLAWVALSGPAGTQTHRHVLPGTRGHIRRRAAMAALNHVRLALM